MTSAVSASKREIIGRTAGYVSAIGFVAACVVGASTSGFLPLDIFIDGPNPNLGVGVNATINHDPFLPSILGIWVASIWLLCFVVGFMLFAYMMSTNNNESS